MAAWSKQELRNIAEADDLHGMDRTRVELEHRDLDRLGEQAAIVREVFDSPAGWQGLLESFARETARMHGCARYAADSRVTRG